MALDNTILAFNNYAATDEAIALSDTDFVAQAYASLLGLDGAFVNSDARIAFWVEKLEAGLYNGEELTRDNFAAAFLAAAASATGDEPTLTAEDAAYNVAVTTYLSDNDATITDLASVAAAIVASGAVAPEEPADVTPLAEALTAVASAYDAKAAFLDSAAENTLIDNADGDDTDAVVDADVATALDDSVDNVNAELVNLGTIAGTEFTDGGVNAKAGLIADGREDAAAAIAAADAFLTALNSDIDAVDGLRAALNDSAATTAAVATANDAVDAAAVALAGKEAEYNTANTDTVVIAADGTIVDGVAADLVVLDAGDLVLAPGITEETNPGITALLDASIAKEAADAALVAATTAETDADNALAAITLTADQAATFDAALGYDATTTGADIETDLGLAETDLSDAQDLSDALEAAIAAWEEMKVLDAELGDLNTAITDAEAAIEDSVEDGGLGLHIVDFDGSNATANNDIFVYDNDADETIANFGAAGEDQIYFGSEFSLVALGDSAITDNVGDVAATEIFWEEVGADLVLYVEDEAFAGNGSTTADITTITLTGVAAADVTYVDGFLIAGTVA
ncbi:MAG: hypothetical protein R3189_04195 [Thiomicrorhabdus chilensis]|uniref:hypothetical protein n=1 Tax=Thiomicrorhabdus chilensis TaxID=63656 RepID=UPI00299D3D8D|nr:hypothetical protein [Thiomicrorhabdus chilensis]MDX1347434.1 hypothetical protein [Thiomicrorhabdus chilensis]